MSIEGVFVKGPNGTLVPATEDDAAALGTLKMGQAVKVTITQFHNLRFHRKLFVLFRLAFDIWQPEKPVMFQGEEIGKSFEQFREDLTILAGHYEAHARMDGSVRVKAKSLSFARMNDDAKLKVYRDVLTATWNRVLKFARYETPEQADAIVDRMTGFE